MEGAEGGSLQEAGDGDGDGAEAEAMAAEAEAEMATTITKTITITLIRKAAHLHDGPVHPPAPPLPHPDKKNQPHSNGMAKRVPMPTLYPKNAELNSPACSSI